MKVRGQPDLRIGESEGSGGKGVGRPWIAADPSIVGAAEAIAMPANEAKKSIEQWTTPTHHETDPVEKNRTFIHDPSPRRRQLKIVGLHARNRNINRLKVSQQIAKL
jgi:hypothetical protein